MPNWVYNTISNYTEDLHEKYKGEDKEIDFNKIIPEPEEISNTISGSISTDAKQIVAYRDYCQEITDSGREITDSIKYDSKNPLKKPIEDIADKALKNIGEVCVENPDKSLNQLIEEPVDSNCRDYRRVGLKSQYEIYTDLFGNVGYSKVKDIQQIYQKYIDMREESFQRDKASEFHKDALKDYKSIEDYGRRLYELKEKYGFDNWYDWRCAHWGTKWNASETSYDEENHTVRFDTAWSIPYPIIAKIADDNPKANLDGYSEEETGWFEEYKSQDGKLIVTARGDLSYDEETDETTENREEVEPNPISYTEMRKEYVNDWNCFKQSMDKIL